MRRLSGSSHAVQMELASSAYQDKQERFHIVLDESLLCSAVQCASRCHHLPAEACRSGDAAPGSPDGKAAAGQTPSGACTEGCSLTGKREGDVPRCAQHLRWCTCPYAVQWPQEMEHMSNSRQPRSGLSPAPAD